MLISMAVPLRMGTRGVSSIEISGFDRESAFILNASMRPGLMVILHSSGSKVSQVPFSDHAKMDAMALEDFVGCNGTVRYPLCDAELEGDRELASELPDSRRLGLGSSLSSLSS